MRISLSELCGYRSGDKGNLVNIALFAYSEDVYELIKRVVTAERVADHFAPLVRGEVTRYEARNLLALNFVLRDALGGGGPSTLRADNLGKTFGGTLVRLEIEAPDALVEASRRSRPDTGWARSYLQSLPQS